MQNLNENVNPEMAMTLHTMQVIDRIFGSTLDKVFGESKKSPDPEPLPMAAKLDLTLELYEISETIEGLHMIRDLSYDAIRRLSALSNRLGAKQAHYNNPNRDPLA